MAQVTNALACEMCGTGLVRFGRHNADQSSFEKWYYEVCIIVEDLIDFIIRHLEAHEKEPLLYAGSVVSTYSSSSQLDVNSQGRRELSFQGLNPKEELSEVEHLEIKGKNC